ncbi:bifunctional hydroxymethylpyrimidine kinase/phosphomethylpyrimidine kinase [Secundilactobacillus folii]|uniref:Hydroxymethylpyrimidine/phosphomethylpyrimidine kinase n=1 Tax=Secundilactobacillus folii TaxID=2678357 RepID=A0A7X2XZA2_9LACO|nr:bifunctional hydroxymethylpyrimidine kinase/phosphomethylpyrimidine kinase [Secundilactobacillus folii]MTV83091.1 bifunctional hydroxymethylpyrimidine kinase/phosphomethylpyrimidine kinase [Secundilactobacillus folii]
MVNTFPQAMTIAGSDCDGSAGMQADMHTFFTREVYGISVMTTLVAGNSYGIHASHMLPTDFIDQEFKDVADDFKVGACKTGMLADTTLIRDVVKNYQQYDFGPMVVDPVIMTKHGNMLLEEEAYETMRNELIPLATVVTPNFYETQKMAEMTLKSDDDLVKAAHKLQDLGAKNIIAKGYHQDASQTEVRDYVLLESGDGFWLTEPYHHTDHVNGTGDSLSACIAAELAKGETVENAIRTAKRFVNVAIGNPIDVGHKFGPINHWAAQREV